MGELVAAGEGDLDNAAIIRALERDRGSPVVTGEV